MPAAHDSVKNLVKFCSRSWQWMSRTNIGIFAPQFPAFDGFPFLNEIATGNASYPADFTSPGELRKSMINKRN